MTELALNNIHSSYAGTNNHFNTQKGTRYTTLPTRWSSSGWRADDHDLHKNNKTQYFIIDKIKIICNYKSWFIHHLITQLKCYCQQRRNVI